MPRLAPLVGFALALTFSQSAQAMDSSAGRLDVTPIVTGLDTPWAVDTLPNGTILITERRGRLLAVDEGGARDISGVGQVAARGQGGLLDILVPRDFAQSRELLFTYSKPQPGGTGTALARATLSEGLDRLTDWRVLWELTPGSTGGRHFGSRLVEAPDGTIFLTVGDRGDRPSAQDLGRENGSVLRLNRDGTIPADNPFAGQQDVRPEIWSYGHRNPQGAALDPKGQLYTVEHGARGGDEVNRIAKGANYGWPVISYGRHYSGAKIGDGTAKPGMEQPVHYWDPSIAPSGMMFHDGKEIPEWRGNAFVGSLKFNHIARLAGTPLREVERLDSPETLRVRDVIQGPDGAIWFLSEGRGALYRITKP
ncbi:PQQ-dependent sugar dehydrogenase [Roseovarius sp. A21]|uniref:PQQ-dependent sugar dehydrogenase n=1 Tax=Roseovarius bejariae TaxID=2576383 RepID=A0A844CGN3_9RHOB|nr:PQQ-dependent sugar dehydrogenase [Roseovarius bejariae]MRU13852.1 PQQ-dependent sugar dehydrogenase [Roseovarius bejariae]